MSPIRPTLLAAALLASAVPLAAQSPHATHGAPAASVASATSTGGLLPGLGTWSRRIATTSPLAQRYFDQGLRLYYAFNHAESARAFRQAQRLDASCVMCAWGEAMALGPNINAPMDSAAERQAIAATQRAVSLVGASRAAPREAALVDAIELRYLAPASTRAARDSAYANAMSAVAESATDDVDILTLAAEAAMDLSPWTYWTKQGAPRPATPRLLARLERAMRLAPDHPGACHFYIHAVEAVQPQRAVECAERLAKLMPGAGHIVHMPAHIYIRVGRWADAIDINRHAVHADEQYLDGPRTSETAFYTAAYASHNHHFLALAAVMAGNSAIALEASRRVVQIVTPDLARQVSVVEPMLAIPLQTLVSFGRWDEILRAPLPPSDLRVGIAHGWYARGIAFAATARAAEARATIDSIDAVAKGLPEGETRVTLEIASLMVGGEIALRGGDALTAVKAFTKAAALEDRLAYMEPPTWYYPVRQSLGKALLAAGKAREAEDAYRSDLQRFPENGWSLRGLANALTAQGRTREAAEVERRFAKAWRMADVRITNSRF